MWLKNIVGEYRNINGATLGVTGSGTTWSIALNNTGNPIANGFTTQQEAQDALDMFMREQGFETIPNGGN